MIQKRLISLDVLRGLTVMFMIFVNNPAGKHTFPIFQHASWNGMTPCDLVFPFFLFIMGVSTYLSLKKTDFRWSQQLARKIAKRTIILFLIGLFINWLEMACDGNAFNFSQLRITGVMQRIAMCYAATALLAIVSKNIFGSLKGIPGMIIVLLISYSALILAYDAYVEDRSTNILNIIDGYILGYQHLYQWSPVDPEGLTSTLPSIAHTMIGFWIAYRCFGYTSGTTESSSHQATIPTHHVTMKRFLLAGTILVCAGALLTFVMPLNKRIWSPSFVCMTCGLASLAQGLLIYLLDIRKRATKQTNGNNPATNLTLIFGTNPLFLYVASDIIAIVFGTTGLKNNIYDGIHTIVTNAYWSSAVYATLFVALHALLGYPLWKRHIHIKI